MKRNLCASRLIPNLSLRSAPQDTEKSTFFVPVEMLNRYGKLLNPKKKVTS